MVSTTPTRHLEFDPEGGVPLEAWLAHRRAEGWVPKRGGIAVVNTANGTLLAFRMRRVPPGEPLREDQG